jgi:hypothetical protein
MIYIRGSESPFISGAYCPSSETCGGFPVYMKAVVPAGSDYVKLLYVSKSQKWKIREYSRQKATTIAKVLCFPPSRPEYIKACWVEKRFSHRGNKYLLAGGIRVELEATGY